MIAWMYCVGEGRGSCEDATMSKSLPVASLFCWFCKYEVHELVYFLTFRKIETMFCFVLLVKEVKVFYLNDPPFCFWYRNIDMSNFCVGLVGGGRDGWGELRTTSRTCFLYISDKKGTFHFHFSDKIHIKRNFLKKGTKWQSLVNSLQTFFYPTFFLLQLNPTYMKRILHFKNITFKSSYNWFKFDIHQQLRPLTANYLAMFKVTSTTIYT